MTVANRVKLKLPMVLSSSSGCVGTCTFGAEDKAHPNKTPFSGVLLRVDVASDKPPHGANGHRIYVPKAVAQKRLGSLIGMALNFASDLNGHSVQHKVGVITGARIVGDAVKVNGFIWSKDFPTAVNQLRSSSMGMSMELSEVYVSAKSDQIWNLEDFHFSGATALKRDAAAYHNTTLNASLDTALAAAAAAFGTQGDQDMPKEQVKAKTAAAEEKPNQAQLLVAGIAASVGTAVKDGIEAGMTSFRDTLEEIGETNKAILAGLTDLQTVASVQAGAEEETEEIEAAGPAKDEEADPEAEPEEEEEDDAEEEVEAEIEDLEEDPAEQKPGHLNKDAKNKGNKTATTGGTGKEKSMPVLAAASRALLSRLNASNQKLIVGRKKDRKEMVKLQNKIEAMEAQLEAAAESTDRRTVVSAELGTVLAKSNVDIHELQASGRKITIAEMDQMLSPDALGHQLDPTTRMAIKNQALQRGWLEQGEVVRNYSN